MSGAAASPPRRVRHALDTFLCRDAGLRTTRPLPAPTASFGGTRRVPQFEACERAQLAAHRELGGDANVTQSVSDTALSEMPPAAGPLQLPRQGEAPRCTLDTVWRQKMTGLPPEVAEQARRQLTPAPPPTADDAAAAPAAEAPKRLLVLSRPRMHGGVIVSGEMREVDPPGDRALLSPAQRRELYSTELQAGLAATALAQARRTHNRLAAIARSRHPNGVLGSETPQTEGGAVYCERKKVNEQLDTIRERERRKRTEFIESANTKWGAGGPEMLCHSGAGHAPTSPERARFNDGKKFLQSKAPGLQTRNQFSFERMQEGEVFKRNAASFNKHMFAHEGRGRTHNIVTGTAAAHVPSNPYA
eukprot:TRINITY_DN65966_c0_g1_i1.p1 TRINITY_DN65966_c0_g1~~TRINITY_DN65966_c0_g1_i1.p1  ORF type:complete len:385 (+),score=135.40 TRINITY_DN65966_c0_g1_i1:75-1157(+)